MPLKKKSKKKKAAKAKRKPTSKAKPKKKALKKKAVRKKAIKKKPAKKKTAKKTARKKASKKATPRSKKRALLTKPTMVEPGPPPGTVPPVEEPAANEEALGTVTHYYSHLGVAIVQINKGTLRTGNQIHIKGHTTDIVQQVESMEYEHQHVDQATPGQSVGIKVVDHVREHDILYLMK